jgi:hypothetical protein
MDSSFLFVEFVESLRFPDFAVWCFLGETVGDNVVIVFGVEVAGALDVVGEL